MYITYFNTISYQIIQNWDNIKAQLTYDTQDLYPSFGKDCYNEKYIKLDMLVLSAIWE